MKNLMLLLAHLLTTVVRLLGPGGANAVIAENLLLKQQLLIFSRARRRASNFTALDRFLFGLWSLCINPCRLLKVAFIIKPSTLLKFLEALYKRKIQLLFHLFGSHRKAAFGTIYEMDVFAVSQAKHQAGHEGAIRLVQAVYSFSLDP